MDEATNKTYVKVFGTLLALTALTVGVSRIHLGGAGNLVVGLAIAVAKASLVGLFFMHLKWDVKIDRYLYVAVFFPVVLFMILALALMPDIAYRMGDAARDLAGASDAGTAGH